MRKFLWGFVVVITASIIILACQKEASSPQQANTKFDDKAAKEWYYGTYKKSAEWQGSNQKGKKLPDWKHPIIGKIGNNEVVEFPLSEATKTFALPGNNSLTTEDKKRLADASMSRILFIKNNDNSISVKEVDYIPDWQYVQNKNFDISYASVLKPDNDFTGRIVVKNWNGTTLSLGMLKNGKLIKKGNIVKGSAARVTDETCTTTEFCVWQQDCVLTIYGDGMMTDECEPWYNTGDCWFEEFCWGGDPCELYGVGCEGGGGGEEPGVCDMTSAEAQALIASITSSQTYQVTSGAGTESSPDANGIIRQPVLINRHEMTYNWGMGFHSTYSLFFNAIRFKTVTNSTWKWETVIFDGVRKTEGGTFACLSASVTASISGPVLSADKKIASFSSTVFCQTSITCLAGMESGSMSDNISGDYDATDNW